MSVSILSVSVLFSEPKIPQLTGTARLRSVYSGFSALQRAENSSIADRTRDGRTGAAFQCSSASRKFLNFGVLVVGVDLNIGFSALQRAENSSIRRGRAVLAGTPKVSVLFSEPKIPQLVMMPRRVLDELVVSVLFSEPKIPQFQVR